MTKDGTHPAIEVALVTGGLAMIQFEDQGVSL
jgi:hypothetical protein